MEQILEFIKTISPIGVAVVGAISLIYQTYAKIKLKRRSKNSDKYVDVDIILNSWFFIRMQQYRNYTIPNIKINHELKSLMIKKFLDIKFKTFYDLLKNFDYSKPEILIHSIMTIGVAEYERKALKAGIPEMFLTKFNNWHRIHANTLIESISYTLKSNLYSTLQDKYLSIFDNILNAFSMTVQDAEKTMNEFNGELERYLDDKTVNFKR